MIRDYCKYYYDLKRGLDELEEERDSLVFDLTKVKQKKDIKKIKKVLNKHGVVFLQTAPPGPAQATGT